MFSKGWNTFRNEWGNIQNLHNTNFPRSFTTQSTAGWRCWCACWAPCSTLPTSWCSPTGTWGVPSTWSSLASLSQTFLLCLSTSPSPSTWTYLTQQTEAQKRRLEKSICWVQKPLSSVFSWVGNLHGVPHQLHGDDPHSRHLAHLLTRHMEVHHDQDKLAEIKMLFQGSSWSSSPPKRPPSARWQGARSSSSLALVSPPI